MDNNLLTLSKIFTERLFRIPDYQRGYAWTEKQLTDFWSDIQQMEHNKSHYTGVLTLENVPRGTHDNWDDDKWIVDAKNYQAFYVVDGQQRLTTAIILIQVIVESIQSCTRINYSTKEEIQKKFICESKDGGISRSYIFGYEKDNPSYDYLKKMIFGERVPTDIQDTTYTQNLLFAKQFFAEKIGSLDIEGIEKIFWKVTQGLRFNLFTITEEVDVCVSFETMNNRGKPLSQLEFLKNRLIYISIKINADDEDKKKLRRSVNDCWKVIYHNLGRNKNETPEDDRFLFTHYLIYFKAPAFDTDNPTRPERSYRFWLVDYGEDLLSRIFITKNLTTSASGDIIGLQYIYNYVNSLQDTAQHWYDILNPTVKVYPSDICENLERLRRLGIDIYQLLLVQFMLSVKNNNLRDRFLKILERHIFINGLADRGYQRGPRGIVNGRLLSFMSQLHLGAAQDKVEHAADNLIRRIEDDTNTQLKGFIKDVSARFRSDGFYIGQTLDIFYMNGIRISRKIQRLRERKLTGLFTIRNMIVIMLLLNISTPNKLVTIIGRRDFPFLILDKKKP